MSKFFLAPVIATLALALAPIPVLAAPNFEDGIAPELGGYVLGGSKTTAEVTLIDDAVCADDTYDYETDVLTDRLGNDYLMAGAVIAVQSNAGGSWQTIGQATITRDDIEPYCEDGEDGSLEGNSGVAKNIAYTMPMARQDLRITVTGGAANLNLVGGSSTIFPRFRESYLWSPGPGHPKPKRKGYMTVDVKTDARLAGTKVFMLVSNRKNQNWRAKVIKPLKRKGKNAVVRLQYKSKGTGAAYVCIDYQQRFPQMSYGVACPRGPLSQAQMEKLFPGSTRGW